MADAKSTTSLPAVKGGNVTSAGWQVTPCDPIRHASSRSGAATLRTAMHLLLCCTCRTAVFSRSVGIRRITGHVEHIDWREDSRVPGERAGIEEASSIVWFTVVQSSVGSCPPLLLVVFRRLQTTSRRSMVLVVRMWSFFHYSTTR